MEIADLIRKLETTTLSIGGAEAVTLERLRLLYAAVEKSQHAIELNPLFQELKQFWLESIDWCSQLSRDIERLLILQEELAAGG